MTCLKSQPVRRVWISAFAVVLLTWFLAAGTAAAQALNYAQSGSPPAVGLELLQEEPHDLVFFTEDSGGGWVKTRLLDLPGRDLPDRRTGELKMEILGIEGKTFAAKWSDIARVDLWEERLAREAEERIAAGDFTGAYPFLSVLIRDYPGRPGLRELRSEFLWNDAIQRAQEGELGPTLAMLEELYRYNPEYRASTVVGAIGQITDRLMQQLVEENQLDQAQQMLARLKEDYAVNRSNRLRSGTRTFWKWRRRNARRPSPPAMPKTTEPPANWRAKAFISSRTSPAARN